jgi:hypothetical protein
MSHRKPFAAVFKYDEVKHNINQIYLIKMCGLLLTANLEY